MIEKVKKLVHKDPISEITSNVQTMKMQMDKDQTETRIKVNLGKRIRSKKKNIWTPNSNIPISKQTK